MKPIGLRLIEGCSNQKYRDCPLFRNFWVGVIVVIFVALLACGILTVVNSFVGGVILRGSCSIFNRISGSPPASDDGLDELRLVDRDSEFEFQAKPNESKSPYAAPQTLEVATFNRMAQGVPYPSYGNAVLICFIGSLSIGALSLPAISVAAVFGVAGMLVAVFALMVLGLLLFATVICWRLPTSLGNATAVAIIYLVILVLVVISIVGVVVGFLSILG